MICESEISNILKDKYSDEELKELISCYRYQEKIAMDLQNEPLSLYEFLEQFNYVELYKEYEEESEDETFLEYIFNMLDEYNLYYYES